jgi:RNA polymerase sigma-70 factor, ECF subfamily
MATKVKIDFATAGDRDVAALCAARDDGALRHVITANNQRLFRAAWSILKDRGDAEEAVQATYLSAFARIGSFEGRSSLSTWLTRIVVNEALGRLRAVRRRKAQLDKAGVLVMDEYRDKLMRGSEPAAPDAALAREQLRVLLEEAIAGLPDAFRTVFVLREIEGLTVEETGLALDLPPNTVKTRLLRARRKLQDALAPDVHSALTGSFPFAGADCAAMTERVLAALRGASAR